MVDGACDRLKTAPAGGVGRIRRRRTIYVEGYDPMGAKGYFSLFRQTHERFKDIWPLSSALHPLEVDSDDLAHWSVDISGDVWQCATRYDFVRLERFIRADMAKPTLSVVLDGLRWYFGDLISGAQYRIFRASWRFGLHLFCFQFLLLVWVAAAALFGFAVDRAAAGHFGWPALPAVILSVIAGLLLLHALRPLANRLRVIQINCCWATVRRFARGQPTWLDEAVETAARHVVEAVKADDVDELAIVGHSAGGITSTAIVARALELDPDLGRSGPPVVLLTLGSVMPAAALPPSAHRMRDIVRRLATATTMPWVDCQSRKDVMCFGNFDPVDGVGVHVGAQRCNPLLWRIRFRDMILPQAYGSFRRSFFRMHYQFIMAGDRPAPYDYILLTAGPAPIAEWPHRDRELMAALSQAGTSDGQSRRDPVVVGAGP